MELSTEEKFGLLPKFWHVMLPSERRVVMAVIQSNNFEYFVSCLKKLDTE